MTLCPLYASLFLDKIISFNLLIVNSQNSKERYNKKILGERIARLCGGIAIIQVPHVVLVHRSKHLGVSILPLECQNLKLYFGTMLIAGWCSDSH